MPSWKQFAFVGGAIAAGAVVAGGLIYVANKRGALRRVTSYFVANDEGFAEASMLYEPKDKKILVLGLEGSGKTTLLAHLSASSVSEGQPGSARRDSISGPTEGFKVMTITRDDRNYSIWEIGGKSEFRQYWNHFFQDTDLLVFVIDSTNQPHHSEAYDELRKVLADERLRNIPLLIVATKQDLPGAIEAAEILHESGLTDDGKKRKLPSKRIQIVATKRNDNHSREAAYDKMFEMCDL